MDDEKSAERSIDVERVVLVPILFCLWLLSVAQVYARVSEGMPATSAGGLDIVRLLLTSAFYALMVVLLLVRRPAKRTRTTRMATVGAYCGSFLPFALLFNTDSGPVSIGTTSLSIVLMTVGLLFSVYSLSFLGRSFGALARARRLVRSGPYRYVRHPLYAGEFVTFAGAVVGQLTVYSAAIFCALVVVQVYRALQEENVLEQAFPEYAAYRQTTARFLPGIV